ncbi:MAG: SurA N-terminal domain-containing protein [Candidatus Omnitrophica bacterium]|nr:SurA N-terminal domain-containing protein [Candidatus Omnitrophota bacterium]
MLKALRNKKTAKKLWIVLAIVIIPAFVFWGLGSALRSKQEVKYAGVISGRKVSALEFRDALSAVRNQLIMQYGDKFHEIEQLINIESQAWERIILLHEAKNRRIQVSDREVIELIESYPFFSRNGSFDNRIYNESLQYLFRTQPRAFEEQTRQNINLSRLFNQVTKNVRLEEEEVREEYERMNEEISIDYIAALPSEFRKNIEASDNDLVEYFKNNSVKFKRAPSFNLDYLKVNSEDTAKELMQRLSKNKDLHQAAEEMEIDINETGLFTQIDPIPGIGWAPKVTELIAGLEAGEISPPVKVDQDYYFLRLKEKKSAFIPDLEEIKDKVKEKFIDDQAKNLAREKIDLSFKELQKLYEQNPKSANFDKVAKTYGLISDSTNTFKFGSYIEEIGGSDNFWLTARELKDGRFSEIINIPTGFYIIKLKSMITIDEEKFKEEKEEFSGKLLMQKKLESFNGFTTNLKRKIQGSF